MNQESITLSIGQEITQLHQEITSAWNSNLPKAIRVGELLSKAKKDAGHGNWLSWLKDNIGEAFSEVTAQYEQEMIVYVRFSCSPHSFY